MPTPKLRAVIPLLALVTGSSAVALDRSTDGMCQIGSAYEVVEGRQPTVMLYTQRQEDFDQGDTVWVTLGNSGWTIADDEDLGVIRFTSMSDGAWFENRGIGIDNGFEVGIEWKHFRPVFSTVTHGVEITRRKDGSVIDRLALWYSEFLTFEQCRSKFVAAKAEKDRIKELKKAIPADPFAKP